MSKAGIAGIKHMLSTGEYADVHFLVGDGDAKELLSAHRVILKYASDVFETMFRFDAQNANEGNSTANCPVVEVPDVETAAFKVMLRFIYTDELSGLNGDNAMAVLYAAKKYNVPALVDAALQIPISKLRNVFFAFAQARLFDLEKYVNDCLHYIDENADALLKSESFLQIDQKLLCEILERDQLKMREEISIWEACHENGIECSATNRRHVLGPALFKIRFPLFSQEEFSEKIVPSGILTTNEVAGVAQYHTNSNFHGISDGLLYPLQFPSHRRIWTIGTLLMDINNVSEFVGENAARSRYSETVSINGLPWKIWAQLNTDNVKYLAFHLLCTAPKEDSKWCFSVRSATFRIVSQKNGAENSTGTFYEHVYSNESSNSPGFTNFISFAEMVDPSNCFSSGEEYKVTVAIDLSVKNEKIDKSILLLDPCKSTGTLSMEIEKMSEFAREVLLSGRKSKAVTYIKGLPWKILAQINQRTESTKKCLGIFLFCAAPKEENWSCKCSATIRIVSQKCDGMDLWKECNTHVMNNEISGWGLKQFISLAHLMDPSNGFYNQKEDRVTLAIDFSVKEAKTENKS
ncbi:hypothetical protein niasHT_025125 [Heterodera trifolii]|uniref:BTB domain-containing protein n=1 Tax=Heterodera trifolii TaxID=157864 RepID=A0ABD2K1C5_9BILA